jgi:hypothetical protein
LCVVNKIKTSNEANETILSFIRSILPPLNKLPASYNNLVSALNIERPIENKICSYCYREVLNSNCENKRCDSNSTNNKVVQRVESIFTLDVERQLRNILKREWNNFKSYKSIFKNIRFIFSF